MSGLIDFKTGAPASWHSLQLAAYRAAFEKKIPKGFEFDAENHRFSYQGEPVPSVTQILKDMGFIDTRWFTEAGRTRGSNVAIAIEYLEKGILDWGSLDEETFEYVIAYQDWKADMKITPLDVEHYVFNKDLWYAGIYDMRVKGEPRDFDVYLKPGKYKIKEADPADREEWLHIVRAYRRKHR